MKKLITLITIITLCLTFTACSLRKEYELYGKERVEALRAEAKTWESGRYLLTNIDTDIMDQAFSFKYNADGTQSYLYEKITADSDIYMEYSDGQTFYVIDKGAASILKEGSEGYVSYSRENPHPYSTGDLLFYENLFVKTSAETPIEGGTVYTYYYDTDKINKALGTRLSEFVTEYVFADSGDLMFFTQRNSDGDSSYSYRIDVIDVNGIEEIENPLNGGGE